MEDLAANSIGIEEDNEQSEVPVTSAYSEYAPPFNVETVVRRMLNSVPRRFLNGLGEVVLTNTSSLPRSRRRGVTKSRRRKVRQIKAAGLYHPKWNGKQPWIELFVDNIFRGWEKGFWLRIPFMREMLLEGVLFHEVGHHIHYTIRPEHREKEDVADVWKVRLHRNYQIRRFPILRLLARSLKMMFGRWISRWQRSMDEGYLRTGRISLAEFNETYKSRPRNGNLADPWAK